MARWSCDGGIVCVLLLKYCTFYSINLSLLFLSCQLLYLRSSNTFECSVLCVESCGVLSWACYWLIDQIWLYDCRLMATERSVKQISLSASKQGSTWFQLCCWGLHWPHLYCTEKVSQNTIKTHYTRTNQILYTREPCFILASLNFISRVLRNVSKPCLTQLPTYWELAQLIHYCYRFQGGWKQLICWLV